MLSDFSRLLLIYRERRRITQRKLAETLSHYDERLRGVNTVTISRWETGTTEPGAAKKSLVLRSLAQEGCLEVEECFEILDRKFRVEILEVLTQVFDKRYQYIIGNHPEFDPEEYRIVPLCEAENPLRSIEHILDIERVTNVPGYYGVDRDKMEAWCRHPGTMSRVVERKGQHLGHYLMLKIDDRLVPEIAHHRRGQYDVSLHELRGPDEPGSYYIHALYGCNPRIAARLNVEAYRHFLRHYRRINNVLIFSSRKDGAEITKDYGIRRVASGVDPQYGFRWYGMVSPVEEILFAEGIVRGMF